MAFPLHFSLEVPSQKKFLPHPHFQIVILFSFDYYYFLGWTLTKPSHTFTEQGSEVAWAFDRTVRTDCLTSSQKGCGVSLSATLLVKSHERALGR